MNRYPWRLAFNALVARIPRSLLKGFCKVFIHHPEIAESVGFHVHPRRFDSPFPLLEEINWADLQSRRALPDIDLRVPESLELVARLAAHAGELDVIPSDCPAPETCFWFNNDSFTDFDAASLHTLLRHLKPRRYIELGCGFSSYVSSHALARNAQEGSPCEAVYADPEPRRDLKTMLATGRILQQRVQDLPLEMFQHLEAGDVLFIDTSHVLKVQSDVVRELLELLPALRPGVWIHFHDVFTPYDYPDDWVRSKVRLAANEQYGLECLLSGGGRYEVMLPLYLLWREHAAALQKLFPRGKTRPHGFWIRKQSTRLGSAS